MLRRPNTMDQSFTFLTSAASSTRTNSGAPKFSKLSRKKLQNKENYDPIINTRGNGSRIKSQSLERNSNCAKNNSTSLNSFQLDICPESFDYLYRTSYQEERIIEQLEALDISRNDSFGSLKSRSDSLHFYNERSMSNDFHRNGDNFRTNSLLGNKCADVVNHVNNTSIGMEGKISSGKRSLDTKNRKKHNRSKSISDINISSDLSVYQSDNISLISEMSELNSDKVVSSTPSNNYNFRNNLEGSKIAQNFQNKLDLICKSNKNKNTDNFCDIHSSVQEEKLKDNHSNDIKCNIKNKLECVNNSTPEKCSLKDLKPNDKEIRSKKLINIQKNISLSDCMSSLTVSNVMDKAVSLPRKNKNCKITGKQTIKSDDSATEEEIDKGIHENAVVNGKNKKKVNCNNNKKKLKSKKKVDSFIISDSSVEESCSVFYHKFITNSIKADTRSLKKQHIHLSESDGLFSPFLRKKLTFENSDKGNDTPCKKDSKIKNKPKFVLLHDSDISANDTLEKSFNYLNSPILDQSDVDDDCHSLPDTSNPSHDLIKINRSSSVDDINEFRSIKSKYVLLHDSDISNGSDSSLTDNVKEGSQKITPKVFTSKTTVNVPKKSKYSPKFKDFTRDPITPIAKHNILKRLTCTFNNSPEPRYHSFLKSLSVVTDSSLEVHPEAVIYKTKYKKSKEELASRLFNLYNRDVFKDQLPSDMAIEWNTRMRTSSGYCYNGRTMKVIDGDKNIVKTSRIVLSSKILVTPDRLRDTLIHELCHAACWMINNKNDGHGPIWKSWAAKAMRTFPELPKIKRCHDYAIKTKYKYRCIKCGYSIGRHSKSLNLQRKRCGYCFGEFELLLNRSGTVTGRSPNMSKPRQLSKFALFVKENYGTVKKENSTLKHGQIMKLLGVKFAAVKNEV